MVSFWDVAGDILLVLMISSAVTVFYSCLFYSVPAESHAGPDEEAGGRKYSETGEEEEGGKGKEEEEKA